MSRIASFSLFISFLFYSCANRLLPTGGPKDTTPPKITKTFPENETVNFKFRKITIYFDEFLQPGNPASSVLISPKIEGKTKMWIINKKILIKLPKNLQENTTYVITLTPGIKDYTEGNPLSRSYYYAFSTYDKLDTARISGKIINPLTGETEKNFSVFLFPEDSIANSDFVNKKPLYVSFLDNTGFFRFKYLKPGKYYILGVEDKDKSRSLSPNEKIALASAPLIEISGLKTDTLELFSGTIDTIPPKIKSVRPVPKSFRYEIALSEPANLRCSSAKSLCFPSGVASRFYVALTDTTDSLLQLTFSDTLGNYSDTLLKLPELSPPDTSTRLTFSVSFSDTSINHFLLKYTFPIDSSLLVRKLSIIDTTQQKYSYKISRSFPDFSIIYFTPTNVRTEYFLQIDSSMHSLLGVPVDSTLSIPLKLPNPQSYAKLTLTVPKTDTLIYFLLVKNMKIPLSYGKNSFILKEGTYSVFYIKDKNRNGKRDELSLHPYRLPERVFLAKEIKLRGGWEVNIVLDPPKE